MEYDELDYAYAGLPDFNDWFQQVLDDLDEAQCRACRLGPQTPVLTPEGLCAEHAANLRLFWLVGWIEDERLASLLGNYLLSVHDADSGTVDDEDATEVEGLGWIEDTHGCATFVPYS